MQEISASEANINSFPEISVYLPFPHPEDISLVSKRFDSKVYTYFNIARRG